MNHCIGVPATEIRVESTQILCATVKDEVEYSPVLEPRAPVFVLEAVRSLFVFTGRMKEVVGQVRLQGASCPFLFVVM